MLHSKATAALLKLKEIDRKYKIKCSEIVKPSSLSDISSVDSREDVSDGFRNAPAPASGDGSPRLRLDIRMPEAHIMEQATGPLTLKSEVVTIFDQSVKNSPRKRNIDNPVSEVSTSPQSCGPQLSEKLTTNVETTIAEEVPEVFRSTAQSSNPTSPRSAIDAEVTLKSVDSIANEDLPTLSDSGTYSDDFVNTISQEGVPVPTLSSPELRESPTHEIGEPKVDVVVEVVSPKVMHVVSEFDARLDVSVSESIKEVELRVSTVESQSEKVESSRRLQTSQSSSDRSTNGPQINTEVSGASERYSAKKSKHQNSGSPRKKVMVPTPAKVDTLSKSREKVRPSSSNHSKRSRTQKNPSLVHPVQVTMPTDRIPSARKQRTNKTGSAEEVHRNIQGKRNSKSDRNWVLRWELEEMLAQERRALMADGFRFRCPCAGPGGAATTKTESPTSFKPLDLPNVAAFKRPDFEEDEAARTSNERYLHLNTIRERILGIRHWLKQQFILYGDYSTLVSNINAKYIPVTLKETKKMIRDMQRFNSNRNRRTHVR